MTVAPSDTDDEKLLYIGKAAHISAAAQGGPRYESSLAEEQRSSIGNAIFLCSNCADMIDKNNGKDFSKELLLKWKLDHEKWVREQLNKSAIGNEAVFNVTSNNQSGGITAGIVNFAKPGRHLNATLIQQLNELFQDPTEKITISAIIGSAEALDFAEGIRQHLNKKGFTIGAVGQFMQAPAVKGQVIKTEKNGTRHIQVGIQT